MIKMNPQRVIIALSGGVDSAVCAALLKEQGFEVIALTIKVREAAANLQKAKAIARKLAIPHYVIGLERLFEQKVIADFCAEYKDGRTPNPCIRCNKYIKFGVLLKKAAELSADYIATGHYARIEFDRDLGRYLLKKGLDVQKDQSYFLYTLNQKQLSRTLMPLGEYTKEQVREIARRKNLPVRDLRESQEICFIPDNNYARFVQDYTAEQPVPGPILDKAGRIIGEHPGVIFYTIGQRKGIGIAEKRPLYVRAIDSRHNSVVVGNREEVYSSELVAENINLIYPHSLKTPLRAEVKVRYLHPPAPAVLETLSKNRLKISFDQPQWAVTPGQAVVFYERHTVLGGATIKETA